MVDPDPNAGTPESPDNDLGRLPDASHPESESQAERRRGFARRALLEAGWTIPILAAASKAFGLPMTEAGTDPGDQDLPLALNHFDKSVHVDNNHTDGFHNDSTSNHLDTNHLDSAHNDETIPHADAPHVDSSSGVHGDSGHADSSTHIDGFNHSDINHHFDSADHYDMGHHDQPHTDQTSHEDHTHGIQHKDSIVEFTDYASPAPKP
ncbi:MAG TPA: hypothetical protein VJP77_00680 [Planctomycetota bacterium]|nr:hypothetical protein [Planctomycetota bacterium]